MKTLFDHIEVEKKSERRVDPPPRQATPERLKLPEDSMCGRLLRLLRRGPISKDDLHTKASELGIVYPMHRIRNLQSWGYRVRVSKGGVCCDT